MKKALIVIDMQNDFIDGPLGSKNAQLIVKNVKNKITEYRKRGDTIIFTRDTHQNDYLETNEGKKLPVVHCIENTYGWEIADGLDISDCKHIDKHTFGWIHWESVLSEKYDEIMLVGVYTDICVISNALILKALFSDTEITVDAECCAGVTLKTHKSALEVMEMCHINVINTKKY